MDKELQFNENVKKQIQCLLGQKIEQFSNSQESFQFVKDLHAQVKEAVFYLQQMDKDENRVKKKKKSKLFKDIPVSQSKLKQLKAVRSNRDNSNLDKKKIKTKSKSRSKSARKIQQLKKTSSQIINVRKSKTPRKKNTKKLDVISEVPKSKKKLTKNPNGSVLKKKMSTLLTVNKTMKSIRNSKSQRNSLTRNKGKEKDKVAKSFMGLQDSNKKKVLKKKKKKVKPKVNKKILSKAVKDKNKISEDKLQNLSSINSLQETKKSKKQNDEKDKLKKPMKKNKNKSNKKISKQDKVNKEIIETKEDEIVKQQQEISQQDQDNNEQQSENQQSQQQSIQQNDTVQESIVQLPESKVTADFEPQKDQQNTEGKPTAQFYESEDFPIVDQEDKNKIEQNQFNKQMTQYEKQRVQQERLKLKKRMLESVSTYYPIQSKQVFENIYFAKQFFQPQYKQLLNKQNQYLQNLSAIDIKISELGESENEIENKKLFECSDKTRELLQELDEDLLQKQINDNWSHAQVKDFFVLFYLLVNSQKITDELPNDEQAQSYFVYYFHDNQYDQEKICELNIQRKKLVEDYLNEMKKNNYLHQSTLIAYGDQFQICWSFMEDLLYFNGYYFQTKDYLHRKVNKFELSHTKKYIQLKMQKLEKHMDYLNQFFENMNNRINHSLGLNQFFYEIYQQTSLFTFIFLY